MHIPNIYNLRNTYNDKILKHWNLQEQVQRQWQMRYVGTISIELSSTGVIQKQSWKALQS